MAYLALLQIIQGCAHNACMFCTMYRDIPFRMQPMKWIEEDLLELKETDPNARTIQLLSTNPLAPTYDKLAPFLEKIRSALATHGVHLCQHARNRYPKQNSGTVQKS